jgi:hypothetical protein
MELPAQERFTLQDVANRLNISLRHVEELVCSLTFNYIIVTDEVVGGPPLTRHLYFDRGLWLEHYGERLKHDRAAQLNIMRADKSVRRRLKIFAKFDETSRNRIFKEKAPSRIPEKNRALPTFYNLGPHEVANLWEPCTPQKRYTWPEGCQLHIHRSEVEAVAKQYGCDQPVHAQRPKEVRMEPPPSLSGIIPDRLYTSAQAAKYLGRSHHYLQNSLLRNGVLKSIKTPQGVYAILGQEILNYFAKGSSNSQDLLP